MMLGLPASGKSTWAKEFIKGKKDWIRVNNDELGAMLFGELWAEGRSDPLEAMREHVIETAMNRGLNIVVDNTNLHPKHRAHFTQLIEAWNTQAAFDTGKAKVNLYELEVKDFTNVPVDECIKRNKKRDNPVPDRVIYQMYNAYIRKEAQGLVQDPKLPKAIIVDIDGTIADLGGRNPHVMSKCYDDLPVHHILDLVKSYKERGYEIIFVTGRNEHSRADTVRWLKDKAGFEGTYSLYMRADGSKEPDVQFKKAIFDNLIKGKYYVDFAIEDRSRMVQMYRNDIGIPCLQCADGDF